MLVILVLIVWITLLGLDSYTKHNQNIKVPLLRKLTIPEVEEKLNQLGLKYVIMDSTSYIDSLPKKSVVAQIPLAGQYVKQERKIYLTINAMDYPNVVIPDVFNKTRREAINYLKNKGFTIGKLEYIPDLGRDILLKLKYKNRQVEAGDTLKQNSELSLVLGKGLGDKRVTVPNLKLLSYEEAKQLLQSLSLNIGEVIYDKVLDSIDTLNLKVYQQYPSYNKKKLKMGQSIDIWLTTDSLKLYNRYPKVIEL